jgi:hypothetical protein
VSKREDLKWVVLEELEMGLHPRAISTMLVLVLELLHRGYRVCLSSHSPQVLEMIWAWQNLKQNGADGGSLGKVLGAKLTPSVRKVFDDVMQKEIRAYFFERDKRVTEISGLNPDAKNDLEASWGELLSFTDRANRAVAESASEHEAEVA